MKTNRWVVFGVLILALTAFGFGCGGGASNGLGDGGGLDSGNVESEVDTDNDGFLVSEGDCDDENPSINPNAEDKPDFPNYTDTNCDGVDGDADFAFWVATDGNDANPGTIDQPFLTIQKGVDEAIAAPGDIRDVYVVGGDYTGDVILQDGAGIYGGYGPLNDENLRERNIKTNISRSISALSPFIVFTSTNGQESIVEGMNIESAPNSPAIAVHNSNATLRHNNIQAVDGAAGSMGLFLVASGPNSISRPTVHDNFIVSGNGTDPNSHSVAVIVISTGNNAISEPTLYSNEINSKDAVETSLGIMVLSTPASKASLTAYKNDIRAGSADASCGILMGYDIFNSVPENFTGAEIYQNEIYGGHDSKVSVGIYATHASDTVLIYNNFVTGGDDAANVSAALFAEELVARITNNTLNSGSSFLTTEVIRLAKNTNTTVENNILFTENAPNKIGIYEMTAFSTPTTLKNNLFDNSLSTLYLDFAIGPIVAIVPVNLMPDLMASNNIDGNANFEDLVARDYHLLPNSDAINMGLDQVSIEDDLDRDERPQDNFFDIGADEFTE